MRTHGTLTRWNDDRGFGFVSPAGLGTEVFVHVSAFPKDGVRPHVGELVSFEIETGTDGRTRAVRLMRPTGTRRGSTSRVTSARSKHQRSPGVWIAWLVGVAIVVAVTGYRIHLSEPSAQMEGAAQVVQSPVSTVRPSSAYRCDGRTTCGQMTSCAEAEYFLRHCPNVEMDGNRDGEPCEQQWCK